MHMKVWCANWFYRMGWGYYDAIQAPEQEKAPGGPGKWQNACGTGPYMLTDYKDGHSQTYTKNPKYWDSEFINGKKYKLPFTDKVIMMIIKDEATQLAALRTGKVDLMMTINWKYVADLKKTNPQLQWARKLAIGGFMVALRMDTKPFDDIRVRRALNLAVNKQEIIDSFYGGNAEMINYPYPRTFTSVYTPMEKLPPTARELFTYNPEKAKKLLTEAGYPNGFTFKAQISNNNQEGLDIGAMVVAYLAKVGVKLELETMDYPSYLSKMTKKVMGPGYFFANDHGNPFATIRKNFMAGQTWNPYMMNDEHVDKTWTATIENPNLSDEEAFAEMRKLGVYCLDQAPAIWLPGPYTYAVWWPWVKNYYGEIRVGAHRSGPILARIWIDQDLKKKMGYE
jgi:peptide/nickel transport system substrate-binding protein